MRNIFHVFVSRHFAFITFLFVTSVVLSSIPAENLIFNAQSTKESQSLYTRESNTKHNHRKPTLVPTTKPTLIPTQIPTRAPTPTPLPSSGPITCTYTVPASVTTIDGSAGTYANLKAGDTVCLSAGSRGTLMIKNVTTGTAANPIKFVNYEGMVKISGGTFAGIVINNVRYIKITGDGVTKHCGAEFAVTDQQCGIVLQPGIQRGIANYSTEKISDIEIGYVEIGPAGNQGINLHSDDISRDAWTQYNTNVHHNYIHDITTNGGGEGVYLGTSNWQSIYAPELKGVDLSYNLVYKTGWDGLQVGSAVENCKIHHNKIFYDSLSLVTDQKSGIMINKGSACDAYNNFIKDGAAAWGIFAQGIGGNHIYNNVIMDRTSNGGQGISVSTGTNLGRPVYIWNNTIINIAGAGITISSDAKFTGSQIYNNIIAKSGAFISSGSYATSSNNLTNTDPAYFKFTNTSSDDYSLQSGSPAIDKGITISSFTFDFKDKTRPSGSAYDVGAFEF